MMKFTTYGLEMAFTEAYPAGSVLRRGQTHLRIEVDGKEFRLDTETGCEEAADGRLTSTSESQAIKTVIKGLLSKHGYPQDMEVDLERSVKTKKNNPRVIQEGTLADGTMIFAELIGGYGQTYDVTVTRTDGSVVNRTIKMFAYDDALDPYVEALLDELRDETTATPAP